MQVSTFTVSAGRRRPAPTSIFDTFWRFAAERQSIFFHRLAGEAPPFTNDEILQKYKFTNAYRASDRVSQYLIRNVIYRGEQTAAEVFFRTLLFKFFNKIGTWEYLLSRLGFPRAGDFDPNIYDQILTDLQQSGRPIYSTAYIMPSPHHFGTSRKHHNHLHLLAKMIRDGLPSKVADADSLQSVFKLLRTYPSIGPFLAFQFTIDLNYSPVLNFSEMDFVIPGPGALDGIAKCFRDLGDYNPTDLIRLVTERQAEEFRQRGICFQSLWGRPLQLIDCQNLFCEVDKYARVAHPEVTGPRGRTRIKQRFKPSPTLPEPWYPPKWRLPASSETSDQLPTQDNYPQRFTIPVSR